jgi:hypothetical protein
MGDSQHEFDKELARFLAEEIPTFATSGVAEYVEESLAFLKKVLPCLPERGVVPSWLSDEVLQDAERYFEAQFEHLADPFMKSLSLYERALLERHSDPDVLELDTDKIAALCGCNDDDAVLAWDRAMAEAYGFQRILSDEPTKRAEQIAAYRRFHRATETRQYASDRSRQATVIHVSEELTRLIGPRDDTRQIALAIAHSAELRHGGRHTTMWFPALSEYQERYGLRNEDIERLIEEAEAMYLSPAKLSEIALRVILDGDDDD